MSGASPSRRDFLRVSGAVAAGGGLALSLAGCREAAESAARAGADAPPRVLTPGQVRTMEAFADRILPPGEDGPGAVGLGAVVFMDHYLERQPGMRETALAAVTTVEERVAAAHPGAEGLWALEGEAADAVVAALEEEDPDAFWPLHTLVLFGAFSAPAHGGNRDKGGWALLGFEDRHAWQPPFGHYDAEVAGEGDR